jgi:hypothetical protein
MAGGWSAAVTAAINTFNSLGFGVKLVTVNEEKFAQIVVKLSNGSESYTMSQVGYDDYTFEVNFPAELLHGRAKTLSTGSPLEIFFAGVFLPGKVRNPTPKQKEVIVVHEFIHACGLDGRTPDDKEIPGGDHDLVGVMSAKMVEYGDGLMEMMPEKGAKPMSPIRVGGQTMCRMRMLWKNEGCEKD